MHQNWCHWKTIQQPKNLTKVQWPFLEKQRRVVRSWTHERFNCWTFWCFFRCVTFPSQNGEFHVHADGIDGQWFFFGWHQGCENLQQCHITTHCNHLGNQHHWQAAKLRSSWNGLQMNSCFVLHQCGSLQNPQLTLQSHHHHGGKLLEKHWADWSEEEAIGIGMCLWQHRTQENFATWNVSCFCSFSNVVWWWHSKLFWNVNVASNDKWQDFGKSSADCAVSVWQEGDCSKGWSSVDTRHLVQSAWQKKPVSFDAMLTLQMLTLQSHTILFFHASVKGDGVKDSQSECFIVKHEQGATGDPPHEGLLDESTLTNQVQCLCLEHELAPLSLLSLVPRLLEFVKNVEKIKTFLVVCFVKMTVLDDLCDALPVWWQQITPFHCDLKHFQCWWPREKLEDFVDKLKEFCHIGKSSFLTTNQNNAWENMKHFACTAQDFIFPRQLMRHERSTSQDWGFSPCKDVKDKTKNQSKKFCRGKDFVLVQNMRMVWDLFFHGKNSTWNWLWWSQQLKQHTESLIALLHCQWFSSESSSSWWSFHDFVLTFQVSSHNDCAHNALVFVASDGMQNFHDCPKSFIFESASDTNFMCTWRFFVSHNFFAVVPPLIWESWWHRKTNPASASTCLTMVVPIDSRHEPPERTNWRAALRPNLLPSNCWCGFDRGGPGVVGTQMVNNCNDWTWKISTGAHANRPVSWVNSRKEPVGNYEYCTNGGVG